MYIRFTDFGITCSDNMSFNIYINTNCNKACLIINMLFICFISNTLFYCGQANTIYNE